MSRYYRLQPPETVLRVDDREGELVLEVPTAVVGWSPEQRWGYAGSGPNVTAATLLLDAAGDRLSGGDLLFASQALVEDLLSRIPADEEALAGANEVRAWAKDRLPEMLSERAALPTTLSYAELGNIAIRRASQPAPDWFADYRRQHGDPGTAPLGDAA